MTRADTAVRQLNRGQRAFNSQTVTYRRGNDSVNALDVVPGNTRHDEYGEEATTLTARERDWIVWAGDLLLGGQLITPQRGDELDWTDANGRLRTFEVLPREGDRCFRHTDQTMQQLRVYTVESLPNTE